MAPSSSRPCSSSPGLSPSVMPRTCCVSQTLKSSAGAGAGDAGAGDASAKGSGLLGRSFSSTCACACACACASRASFALSRLRSLDNPSPTGKPGRIMSVEVRRLSSNGAQPIRLQTSAFIKL